MIPAPTRDTVRAVSLVLVMLGAFLFALRDAERRGESRAERRALSVRVETLRVEAARLDTVWRDTLRIAARARDRWDTVRTRDTLRIRDTLYIPLVQAEEAVSTCWAAHRACARAGAAKDSVIAAQDARWAALPPPPSAARIWAERLLYLGAGYGVGRLSGR